MIELVLAMAFGWLSSETANPPVITTSTRVEARERALLAWLPGEIRCGGEIVAAQPLRRPLTSLVWRNSSEQGALAFTFGIDSSGRTIDIRLAPDSTLSNRRLIREIAPSLAATTFPSNDPYSECVISYAPRVTPLKDTPVADLVSYSVNPVSGRLPREGWSRISGDGNCSEKPTPAVKTRAHPAFRSLPATPGVKDWVMIEYDLDESGRPTGIDLIYGTGNEGLARAGKEAVADSEFYDGPRSGCRYRYWRNPATLVAPPPPDIETFRPAGATCSDERNWIEQPTLRFPPAYERRSIEGWAVITYDIAPWGEIGNIEVVESQPTEDFGKQAVSVVRGAEVATTQGLTGCTDLVRFEIADGKQD